MAETDKSIDLSDCSFVDIKTLKLPKLPKEGVADTTKYLVYDHFGYKTYHTAEELDAQVINDIFGGRDLEDDWYTECKTMDGVNKRTVANVKDYGTRSNFWTVNSKKMIDDLKELGWLTPDMDEYKDTKKKFDEIYNLQRAVQNAEYTLTSVYFGCKHNPRTLKVLKKDPKKIERLTKIKALILKEDSTRSRILKTLRDYERKITRSDLRKIMMMKD
jgi:hypothetical protein